MENKHAFAIINRKPQFAGQSLVLPKRHVIDINELTAEESFSLNQLIHQVKKKNG